MPAEPRGITSLRIARRRGLDIELSTPPAPGLSGTKPVSRVAVLGDDYPGVRHRVVVSPGDRVLAGEPLTRGRRHPEIVVPAPASGRVATVELGARRSLVSLQLERDGPTAGPPDAPAQARAGSVRELMLACGLWTSLRTRPFGLIPGPGDRPRRLLVTAIDTNPLAPDPAEVIARHRSAFATGVDALAELCDEPVVVCQRPGARLLDGAGAGAAIAEFRGPHPAGLPGTHINALYPVGHEGRSVWHIGYQDVISLGRAHATGMPWLEREVALAGPAVAEPRILSLPLGADLLEVVAGETGDGAVRIVSGSVLSGRAAIGATAFLGRLHHQITVLPLARGGRTRWPWRRPRAVTPGERAGPFVPVPALDRVAPPGVLAAPLLRALLVGDVERARELGALELVEEDLALASYVCPSRTDYGELLRRVLNELRAEQG